MVRWLKHRRTGRGEWSVTDLRRDYRVCNYNDEHHGGPHLHHPVTGPVVATLDVTEAEADLVARRYAEGHATFHLERYQETLNTWRSESKKP